MCDWFDCLLLLVFYWLILCCLVLLCLLSNCGFVFIVGLVIWFGVVVLRCLNVDLFVCFCVWLMSIVCFIYTSFDLDLVIFCCVVTLFFVFLDGGGLGCLVLCLIVLSFLFSVDWCLCFGLLTLCFGWMFGCVVCWREFGCFSVCEWLFGLLSDLFAVMLLD